MSPFFCRLLSSGSLVVIAPTVEDTAVYECVVSNEAGEDSRSINLTVHGEVTQRLRINLAVKLFILCIAM